jgi:hypothetical protein
MSQCTPSTIIKKNQMLKELNNKKYIVFNIHNSLMTFMVYYEQ